MASPWGEWNALTLWTTGLGLSDDVSVPPPDAVWACLAAIWCGILMLRTTVLARRQRTVSFARSDEDERQQPFLPALVAQLRYLIVALVALATLSTGLLFASNFVFSSSFELMVAISVARVFVLEVATETISVYLMQPTITTRALRRAFGLTSVWAACFAGATGVVVATYFNSDDWSVPQLLFSGVNFALAAAYFVAVFVWGWGRPALRAYATFTVIWRLTAAASLLLAVYLPDLQGQPVLALDGIFFSLQVLGFPITLVGVLRTETRYWRGWCRELPPEGFDSPAALQAAATAAISAAQRKSLPRRQRAVTAAAAWPRGTPATGGPSSPSSPLDVFAVAVGSAAASLRSRVTGAAKGGSSGLSGGSGDVNPAAAEERSLELQTLGVGLRRVFLLPGGSSSSGASGASASPLGEDHACWSEEGDAGAEGVEGGPMPSGAPHADAVPTFVAPPGVRTSMRRLAGVVLGVGDVGMGLGLRGGSRRHLLPSSALTAGRAGSGSSPGGGSLARLSSGGSSSGPRTPNVAAAAAAGAASPLQKGQRRQAQETESSHLLPTATRSYSAPFTSTPEGAPPPRDVILDSALSTARRRGSGTVAATPHISSSSSGCSSGSSTDEDAGSHTGAAADSGPLMSRLSSSGASAFGPRPSSPAAASSSSPSLRAAAPRRWRRRQPLPPAPPSRQFSSPPVPRVQSVAHSLRSWALRDASPIPDGPLGDLQALMEGVLELGGKGALLPFPRLRLLEAVHHGTMAVVWRGVMDLREGPSPSAAPALTRLSAVLPVAVKVFKPMLWNRSDFASFAQEVYIHLVLSLGGANGQGRWGQAWCGSGSPPPAGSAPRSDAIVPFFGLCVCPPDVAIVSAWAGSDTQGGGNVRAWLDAQIAADAAEAERVRAAAIRREARRERRRMRDLAALERAAATVAGQEEGDAAAAVPPSAAGAASWGAIAAFAALSQQRPPSEPTCDNEDGAGVNGVVQNGQHDGLSGLGCGDPPSAMAAAVAAAVAAVSPPQSAAAAPTILRAVSSGPSGAAAPLRPFLPVRYIVVSPLDTTTILSEGSRGPPMGSNRSSKGAWHAGSASPSDDASLETTTTAPRCAFLPETAAEIETLRAAESRGLLRVINAAPGGAPSPTAGRHVGPAAHSPDPPTSLLRLLDACLRLDAPFLGGTPEDVDACPLAEPSTWPLGDLDLLGACWQWGTAVPALSAAASGGVGRPATEEHPVAPPSVSSSSSRLWPARLRIAAEVAAAVAEMHGSTHSHGPIMHRDLKSLNVMFDPTTGAAQLGDFGDAKVMPRRLALGGLALASGQQYTTGSPVTSVPGDRAERFLALLRDAKQRGCDEEGGVLGAGDEATASGCCGVRRLCSGPTTHGSSRGKVTESLLSSGTDSAPPGSTSQQQLLMTGNKGTPNWQAPEVMTPGYGAQWRRLATTTAGQLRHGEHAVAVAPPAPPVGVDSVIDYGPPADVYSLACVVWELVTGGTPHSGSTRAEIVLSTAIHRARLPLPPHAPRGIAHLLRTCWHPVPQRRPPARLVADALLRMSRHADALAATAAAGAGVV